MDIAYYKACLVACGFLNEAGILISCSHCGGICTGLLIGAVHSELIKGILGGKKSDSGEKVGTLSKAVWNEKHSTRAPMLAFMPPASCSALAIRMSNPAC